MDEVAHGIVVIDFHGRVVQANRAARHQLELSAVVGCRQGQLEFALPESEAEMRRAIAKAMQGKRSLIELRAPDGLRLSMAVLPLRSPRFGEPTHAALFFARTSISDNVTLCLFARNHRLTPAEEEVLGILCQGLSAPQAARDLKVAVSTVRSHIRSICAKTRCNSVRELVTRIASLPAVGPALPRLPVH
ncbi:helix-turn-helix transcriptional regulator [Ramlibacter tataouinensis]|nr:helix-turn-helix transcriptional regulator [Ramlibacter tataouinensis]